MKNLPIKPALLQKCEDLICWATQSEAVLDRFGHAVETGKTEQVIDILERCLGRRNATLLQPQRGTPTQRMAAEEVIKLLEVPTKAR